jgi:hypothetical protein
MLYRGLKRLRVPYYRSEANFVLAHFGACVKQVCAGLREKGIDVGEHDVRSCAKLLANHHGKRAAFSLGLGNGIAGDEEDHVQHRVPEDLALNPSLAKGRA